MSFLPSRWKGASEEGIIDEMENDRNNDIKGRKEHL